MADKVPCFAYIFKMRKIKLMVQMRKMCTYLHKLENGCKKIAGEAVIHIYTPNNTWL